MSLENLSDEALLKELEKRKIKADLDHKNLLEKKIEEIRPRPLDKPNLEQVIAMCEEYVDKSIKGEYIDEDFGQYLEETTMQAIMGNDVYKKLSEISKMKKQK